MKILLFDVETRPNISYTWGRYEQNVIGIKEDWSMLCFAYKWLGEKEVRVERVRGNSDKSLMRRLRALLDEADVVVAHNGREFDCKKFAARALVHGLPPPAPYQIIDTKVEAKRYFKFDSNSLNELGRQLGLGEKEKTGGFDLWLGCMANDPKAWAQMEKYNKKDVILLEKVYLRLRPWMLSHPNMSDGTGCPNCGSKKLRSNGLRRTKVSFYRRLVCLDCGAFSRERVAMKDKKPEVVNL